MTVRFLKVERLLFHSEPTEGLFSLVGISYFPDIKGSNFSVTHSFWRFTRYDFCRRDKLTTDLQLVYDNRVQQKKCRSILKHVFKRCDNRKLYRRSVVSLYDVACAKNRTV